MKKINIIAAMMVVGLLFLAVNPGRTQSTELSPELDGNIWMSSSSAEKRAFLYGVGSATVLEYHIRTKHDEQPSRFVSGWVEVFKEQTWADVEKAVDSYYYNNPSRLNEHVLRVIWQNMIQPNLKK
ncbi:MAG: hypothetical protein Q8S17_09270 [Humidesulfovibrio sp.]|nr:hypothetical protein [Humidesulfovibrio sp.]